MELRDAVSGVVDPSVPQTVLNGINLENTSSDNDVKIIYTVKSHGVIIENGISKGTLYSLTAGERKTTSNTVTKDGVTASLTVVWIDNLGPDNQLISVSGGWIPGDGTVSNRMVEYGLSYSGVWDHVATKYPTSNSFSYAAPSDFVGLIINAFSTATCNGSSTIMCEVKPTILD